LSINNNHEPQKLTYYLYTTTEEGR